MNEGTKEQKEKREEIKMEETGEDLEIKMEETGEETRKTFWNKGVRKSANLFPKFAVNTKSLPKSQNKTMPISPADLVT